VKLLHSCENVLVMPPALVTTGEAARAIGVGRATLARWWAEGLVTPDLVTAGGHARWDVERLRQQLRDLRERPE
jgi:DNA-binding transcriptional MerR regulator